MNDAKTRDEICDFPLKTKKPKIFASQFLHLDVGAADEAK